MGRISLLRCKTIVSLTILGLLTSSLDAQYSGGTGTENDPYLIGTAADLLSLSLNEMDWNGNSFELSADIDMAGQTFTPIGSIDHVFNGTFDGKKHVISNLSISPVLVDGKAQRGTGLFGAINGTINNLGLINVNIDVSMYQNSSRVGALTGELTNGSISKCYSDGGTVNSGSGGWTGALIGCLFYGGNRTIEDCYSSTTVIATWRSAGVIGCTRGEHKINRLAFYGTVSTNLAIVEVHNDGTSQKKGIPPTNTVYKISDGLIDEHADGLDGPALKEPSSYPTFDFETVWKIDQTAGYARLRDTIIEQELSFFEKIKTRRVQSDTTVVWKNFGPGMSGYNEEFWCHPSDTNVMFMGPDMHVAYGTWDNGKSWHSIKDFDADGLDLERVNDLAFSLVNPDFGMAVERRGKVFETHDRGRTWKMIYAIPHAAEGRWYNAHSKMAIHPGNDSIWYIGAGGFWDVKGNFRSAASPNGTSRPIYAYGYILKTSDRGQTWKRIASDIADKLDVGRIMINPNYPDSIVIATGQGMFLSSDAGETWNPSNTGLPNNLPKDLTSYFNPITKEYILYTVEQSVYTESSNSITTSGGVFKSMDGGATWSGITGNLGLNFQEISNYSFRDRYALTVAYWLGKTKNEIKAKDYPEHTLPVFRRLVVNPLNKDELYLVPNQRHDKSFGPGDVWKTEDGGQNWKIVTRHGTYWHAATNSSYWASKGMETTPNVEFSHMQASLDQSIETSSANRSLAINAKGQVFIGINQQTHRSNDGGATWLQVDDFETKPGSNAWVGRGDSNLPGRFMLHETGIADRRLFCSGEHGLWQTADLDDYKDKDAVAVTQIEGQVHDINGNHSAHSISTVAVHPNDPNIIYVLVWRQSHRGKLRRTMDGGKTWKNIATIFDADNQSHENVASQYSLLIDPVNPLNMYFTAIYKPISCGTNSGPGVDLSMGEYGVHRSSDGGITWTVSDMGLPANASVNRIILDPDNPEVLYAALNQWGNNDPYGLYKSNDKAGSWNEISIPSQIRSVNNVFIDRNTKHMYISCGARTGNYEAGGVYRSKDKGANWNQIFEAPYVWSTETSRVNSSKILIFAAGQVGGAFKNPGFYLSQDDGENWVKINKGIGQPDKMVDIEMDPYNENILWAAGWGSGWYKAMLPYEGVKAICGDTLVEENKDLSLFGMASLGSQLSYKWIAPEGIELSSDDHYKTTFTAPEVISDSLIVFQLIVSNQQAADTTEVNVKVINTSLPSAIDINQNKINVYPNPVKNLLYIESQNIIQTITIYSVDGKVLVQAHPGTTSYRLETGGFSKGLYLIQIDEMTEKLIKN